MKRFCVFCQNDLITPFISDEKNYFRCEYCGGVFINPGLRLSFENEKDRYLLHNNSLSDVGYISYLDRFWSGFTSFLSESKLNKNTFFSILDWGSGPEPCFANFLREKGCMVTIYDPFFSPELPKKGVLFDCITCIEVVEHFFDPILNFILISSYLKEGGFLAVSTHLLPSDKTAFDSWWYRQDSTHVSFYTEKSLQLLAERSGLILLGYSGNHTWVFKKRASFLPALPL